MKPLFVSLFLCSLTQFSFGQITGQFTGPGEQPIPFANILLLNSSDPSLVKGSLTDEKGSFLLDNINPGSYILRFSGVGFQAWNSPVFEITASVIQKDFGVLVMQEDTRQLGEVVIRTEKPLFEQRVDGTVINVESSVLSKGSSALNILERSPGVVIDHRNNSIELNGKSGVMVMLNGKIMRLPLAQVVTMLNGMSANDIEKIELLTTPPSRYDADGNAGLINIVLKRNKKQGTNGAVSATAGHGWGEKGTASANIARNTGKVDTYASYTFSHDRTYSDLFITSTQNMPVLGGEMNVIVTDTAHVVHNNHNAAVGLDARINAKTLVGGSVNYNSNNTSSTTFAHADYNVVPDSLLLFNGKISGTNHWTNLISSVYLEKEISTGEKLNLDIDYLYFKNDNPSQVQSSFLNRNGNEAGNNDSLFAASQKGFANTAIQVGVLKMDYTKQLSKKLKLETGFKTTYTAGSSLSGIESLVDGKWVNRSEISNDVDMNERIGAAYASANAQLNPRVNLVIGTRFEYSHTHMDDPRNKENSLDRKLGALFPNISLSNKINDHSEILLSYSKRISRPSYNDLASYVAYSDPAAVYTGNPSLKPTITHNLKLGYNYDNYTFSLLLSRDISPIVRYQLTERPGGNLLYISPQNLDYQNNITFQTSLPWKINNWWTMNYSFSGGPRQFKVTYTRKPAEKTYFGYSANFSQTFRLPQNFQIEISGWYNSFSYNGSFKVDGFGTLNAGIKKELKNNHGTFQLAVSDIFRTMQLHTHYGALTEEAFSIKSHVTINTESRRYPIVKLTYSRPFGNAIRDRKPRGSVSNDERERIRKD